MVALKSAADMGFQGCLMKSLFSESVLGLSRHALPVPKHRGVPTYVVIFGADGPEVATSSQADVDEALVSWISIAISKLPSNSLDALNGVSKKSMVKDRYVEF